MTSDTDWFGEVRSCFEADVLDFGELIRCMKADRTEDEARFVEVTMPYALNKLRLIGFEPTANSRRSPDSLSFPVLTREMASKVKMAHAYLASAECEHHVDYTGMQITNRDQRIVESIEDAILFVARLVDRSFEVDDTQPRLFSVRHNVGGMPESPIRMELRVWTNTGGRQVAGASLIIMPCPLRTWSGSTLDEEARWLFEEMLRQGFVASPEPLEPGEGVLPVA